MIAWYYTPMALRFSGDLEPERCVYDNMDELSSFANAPAGLLEWEERLLSKCDVVYVGGRSLFEAKRNRHPNIHVYPSSVDRGHFERARTVIADPADQRSVPGPRIGFFGVIDERMNMEIVAGISRLRPEWSLIMLGPVTKIDPSALPRAANIHWLGCKDYDQLPRYLSGWDAGFMPFAMNELTRFISPTKTPEFLAAGIPLVSTPIRDVVEPYAVSGLVDVARDAPGFVDKIESLLRRERGPWLGAVDAHLAGMSWDETWMGMRRQLDAFLPKRGESLEARCV